MASIEMRGVRKEFRGGVVAIDDLDLTIEDGEFVVLIGPSGCGKTTLLRMIAGLEETSRGDILLGDEDVTDLEPQKRDVAMVFQSYALYPHMTVAQNIGFGLRLRRTAKAEREKRVREAADLLSLDTLLDRRPAELSGGQRQRVAIGRALVREPRAFLLDEPLSNLDAKLRSSMRAELAHLHRQLGITTVHVTHDQTEAMTLGKRVAVFRQGVLQQFDTPRTLFERPANLFVATFMGSPSMNLISVAVEDGVAWAGDQPLPLHAAHSSVPTGRPIALGVRPADLVIADSSTPSDWPRLQAQVEAMEDLGSEHNLIAWVGAPRVDTDATRDAAEGEEQALIGRRDGSIITARVHGATQAKAGDAVTLAANSAAFHFFDAESGHVLASPVVSAPPDLGPAPERNSSPPPAAAARLG